MAGTEIEFSLFNLLVMLILFVITYYLIIKKSFDKNMAAALGAFATLLLIPRLNDSITQEVFLAEELAHDYIILAILLGNLLMVAVASEVAIFQFISIKLLKITKGNPKRLYWTLGGLTFFLSGVVNTIPAILVVGALTIVATKELEYDPRPYILMEIVVTNTGGLTTLISAITNLIIALPFRISFAQFSLISAPIAIILFFVSMAMMQRLVPLKEVDEEDMREKILRIESFNEWSVVKDKGKFKLTGAVFASTMLALLLSDLIGVDIAVVAVGGGLLMVFASGLELERILPKVDWTLLTFFASLFILIKGLELVGLLDILTDALLAILSENPILASITILLFSSLFSGILDNVVLAVALTPILLSIAEQSPNLHVGGMVWALIIGTNLGGGLTPIGSPPGVLGLGILYKETGVKIGWGEFFKSVGVVTVVRIFISGFFLALIVLLFDSSALIGL